MRGGVSCCGCGSSRGYNKEKALLLFKEQAMIASSFLVLVVVVFCRKNFSLSLGKRGCRRRLHRRLAAKVYFSRL